MVSAKFKSAVGKIQLVCAIIRKWMRVWHLGLKAPPWRGALWVFFPEAQQDSSIQEPGMSKAVPLPKVGEWSTCAKPPPFCFRSWWFHSKTEVGTFSKRGERKTFALNRSIKHVQQWVSRRARNHTLRKNWEAGPQKESGAVSSDWCKKVALGIAEMEKHRSFKPDHRGKIKLCTERFVHMAQHSWEFVEEDRSHRYFFWGHVDSALDVRREAHQ